MDSIVHGVAESQTRLSDFHFTNKTNVNVPIDMTLISNDFEYKISVYNRITDNLLELFPTKFDQ